MTKAKKFILTLFLVAAFIPALAPPVTYAGCFSIVAGKEVSVDGYVIMAHNEDDTAPQSVNHP
jgi:hypothetical protein